MIFTPGVIHGSYIIDMEKREDDRGFFARAFCSDEFAKHGLESVFPQWNMSTNHKKGTVRGLHYQVAPHEEAKVMRCIQGEMYDVIVDLRKKSPTYMKWFGIHLSAENKKILYIPKGCANGYQALTEGAIALYASSTPYAPGAEKGIRWNDPQLSIVWPIPENVIVSEKDQNMPDYVSKKIVKK